MAKINTDLNFFFNEKLIKIGPYKINNIILSNYN